MSEAIRDIEKQLESIHYLYQDIKYDASLNLLLKLVRELLL